MQWESIIEIRWADAKLEKVFASESRGRRTFGPERWMLLKRRIATLEATDTLSDLEGMPGGFHALRADRRGTFAASVGGSHRLIFEPDHDPVPLLTDGGIDRARVTHVVVREVVDYHGR